MKRTYYLPLTYSMHLTIPISAESAEVAIQEMRLRAREFDWSTGMDPGEFVNGSAHIDYDYGQEEKELLSSLRAAGVEFDVHEVAVPISEKAADLFVKIKKHEISKEEMADLTEYRPKIIQLGYGNKFQNGMDAKLVLMPENETFVSMIWYQKDTVSGYMPVENVCVDKRGFEVPFILQGEYYQLIYTVSPFSIYTPITAHKHTCIA